MIRSYGKVVFVPENLTALKNGGRISPTIAAMYPFIFDSVKDLDSNAIRTIDKPKNIYINNPLAILDALVLVSEYGFDVDAKCLKAMSKCCSYLDNVKVPLIIRRIRQMLKGEYAKDAFNVIVKNKLFRYIKVFDLFAKKIIKNFSDLSLLERVCILYLFHRFQERLPPYSYR